VEVLLCRRSPEASFMPGVWVFPGGMIEKGETAEECAARELAEEAGIELGEVAELVAWSRWITPEVVPVRFDTHFFVALAGAHAKAEPDGGEITDVSWVKPQAALDSHAAGQLKLVFPTIKTLETLLEHETAEAVIEAARGRDVQPILPRVVGTRESHRVLLPWEDGYEDGVTDVEDLPS
jgi:8-oxo-dGTP pyrophosphatase MutT (NUDIX family)